MQSLHDLEPPSFTDAELDERLARTTARAVTIRRRRVGARATVAVGVAAAVALGAVLAVPHGTAQQPARAASRAFHVVGVVDPAWHVVGGTLSSALGLQCPTATTCYATDQPPGAAGGLSEVQVTRDGGATWSTSALGVDLQLVSRLVCVDATTCALLGVTDAGTPAFLETTDGGGTWTQRAGPSALTSTLGVAQLACTSATACLAVISDPTTQDGTVIAARTTDAGATWTSAALPAELVPGTIACPTADACVVTGFRQSPDGSPTSTPGFVLATRDGGATWTDLQVPDGLGPRSTVACADAATCVVTSFPSGRAATTTVLQLTGGASLTTTPATGLPAGAIASVSCPTVSSCWAVGILSVGDVWIDVGSGTHVLAWMQLPPDTHSGAPVAVALEGGLAASTADGGATWQQAQLPDQVAAAFDVSCPTASQCFALGAEAAPDGTTTSLPVVLLATGNGTPAA